VDVAPVVETTEELVMGMVGWVLAVLLVAFMLPLLAFMYLDVLEAKHEVKQQLEKVEKLRREVDRKNRKTPEEFKDNPLFDRRKKHD
jgi:cell division protein FtsB